MQQVPKTHFIQSSTSNYNVSKLKLVQYRACRIELVLKKYDHISDGLKALNWFNVKETFLNDSLLNSTLLLTQSGTKFCLR